MICQRPRFYVVCDKCGKTIETNAADEVIAAETAQRLGWENQEILAYKGAFHKPRFVNFCPECKEK